MIEDHHRKRVKELGPDVTLCPEAELMKVLIE